MVSQRLSLQIKAVLSRVPAMPSRSSPARVAAEVVKWLLGFVRG